eukprot:COSAG02_NODE_37681_length_439_cov_0.482353_2_plen_79_part_01
MEIPESRPPGPFQLRRPCDTVSISPAFVGRHVGESAGKDTHECRESISPYRAGQRCRVLVDVAALLLVVVEDRGGKVPN